MLIVPTVAKSTNIAKAQSNTIVSINDISDETNKIFAEFIGFTDRKPGSEDEKKS
jgi:hypothetical protein